MRQAEAAAREAQERVVNDSASAVTELSTNIGSLVAQMQELGRQQAQMMQLHAQQLHAPRGTGPLQSLTDGQGQREGKHKGKRGGEAGGSGKYAHQRLDDEAVEDVTGRLVASASVVARLLRRVGFGCVDVADAVEAWAGGAAQWALMLRDMVHMANLRAEPRLAPLVQTSERENAQLREHWLPGRSATKTRTVPPTTTLAACYARDAAAEWRHDAGGGQARRGGSATGRVVRGGAAGVVTPITWEGRRLGHAQGWHAPMGLHHSGAAESLATTMGSASRADGVAVHSAAGFVGGRRCGVRWAGWGGRWREAAVGGWGRGERGAPWSQRHDCTIIRSASLVRLHIKVIVGAGEARAASIRAAAPDRGERLVDGQIRDGGADGLSGSSTTSFSLVQIISLQQACFFAAASWRLGFCCANASLREDAAARGAQHARGTQAASGYAGWRVVVWAWAWACSCCRAELGGRRDVQLPSGKVDKEMGAHADAAVGRGCASSDCRVG